MPDQEIVDVSRTEQTAWKLKDFGGFCGPPGFEFCYVHDAISFLEEQGVSAEQAEAALEWHLQRGHFEIGAQQWFPPEIVDPEHREAGLHELIYRDALWPTTAWYAWKAKDGPWSKPRSPSEWGNIFRCASKTVVERFEDGVYRNRKLADRSYQVHVDDVPAEHPC